MEALKSIVIDWQDVYSPGINAREYGAFPYSPAALRGAKLNATKEAVRTRCRPRLEAEGGRTSPLPFTAGPAIVMTATLCRLRMPIDGERYA